jgi:hypothetical protein
MSDRELQIQVAASMILFVAILKHNPKIAKEAVAIVRAAKRNPSFFLHLRDARMADDVAEYIERIGASVSN